MFPEDATREAIKANAVGKIVEEETPKFDEDGDREYHGITRCGTDTLKSALLSA